MSEVSQLVTVDKIIEFLKETVEEKKILPPGMWIDAAAKLNVLLGDEADKLYKMQQEIAKAKVEMLNEDKGNVSATKLRIEATDSWREMMSQQSKIKRIEEFIRIAKIQARLRDAEMRLS